MAVNLLDIAKIPTVGRFKRPKAREKSVYAFKGLRPSAFAAALIWLERLGFDTHPEVFYEPLLDGIKRASWLDDEQMTCFWHHGARKDRFETRE
ncbi:hypothetical protein [Cereibacter johrii]|uniref:hypothetical protein n=1 Tax=Cereibacter johrii TaxID=445629 RepID=UPI003CF434C3